MAAVTKAQRTKEADKKKTVTQEDPRQVSRGSLVDFEVIVIVLIVAIVIVIV